jgi:hypothetical protein
MRGRRPGPCQARADTQVSQAEGTRDREEGITVTVAGDARRVMGRPMVGRLPIDCPYCEEMLQETPRGWVCRRCHSSVGVEFKADVVQEDL